MQRGLYDLIRYLQKGTNLHIGVLFFGSYGNELCRLPHAATIHTSPVCEQMKLGSAGFRRCFRCRNMAIRKALETKRAFGGLCSNGVYEYMHPVVLEGEVAICEPEPTPEPPVATSGVLLMPTDTPAH